MRTSAGDRDKAIELLATTSLKYKEIEQLTGVPHGTINALALKHRPAEVRAANRRKAGTENVLARHGIIREVESGEPKEAVPQNPQTPVETKPAPRGLSRVMKFSYEAKTDMPIRKEEALEEMMALKEMIRSSSNDEFIFSFSVEAAGGF